MQQSEALESEKSASTLQERRGGQLPMLTLPPKAASQMSGDDHHPLETVVQQPLYNQHSIYSNEESNASFSSNGLSSDQLLASTLFASRSDSPMERPSNPAPRPRKTQQSMHIGDLNTAAVGRQRSLTRPERQRPKPSMVTGIPKALSVEQMSSDISTSPVNTTGNLNHKRAITSNSAHRRFNHSNIEFQDEYNKKNHRFGRFSWWAVSSRIATCCFPGWCLRICMKKTSKPVQQAWREKVSVF
ncbi:hypothetical protein NQZ79_g6961 [Umbelopsis isabellina]|nr:hypothetical protein NQZ79_g6961 [Umbelopsis isabellina]